MPKPKTTTHPPLTESTDSHIQLAPTTWVREREEREQGPKAEKGEKKREDRERGDERLERERKNEIF